MIDTLTETEVRTSSDLKARSISRLQESIGYESLIAILSRAVFALRGEYTLTTAMDAKIKAVGDMMAAEESMWQQEIIDNADVESVVAYEQAEARLLQTPKLSTDKDKDGKLLYPKVKIIDPKTMKLTKKLIDSKIVLDDLESRKAAQSNIKSANKATLTLAKKRRALIVKQQGTPPAP